jgi:hypothetical protein
MSNQILVFYGSYRSDWIAIRASGRVPDRKRANLSDGAASHQAYCLNPLADHREDGCYREERAIITQGEAQ